jgi:hypothetical protein
LLCEQQRPDQRDNHPGADYGQKERGPEDRPKRQFLIHRQRHQQWENGLSHHYEYGEEKSVAQRLVELGVSEQLDKVSGADKGRRSIERGVKETQIDRIQKWIGENDHEQDQIRRQEQVRRLALPQRLSKRALAGTYVPFSDGFDSYSHGVFGQSACATCTGSDTA